MEQTCRIALDTNFLLAIGQFKVDVFEGIREKIGGARFFVPGQVLKELNAVKRKGKSEKAAAEIALKEIKKNKVKALKVSAANADSALLKLAQKGFFVATNDSALKRELKKCTHLLYLRKKSFVEMD